MLTHPQGLTRWLHHQASGDSDVTSAQSNWQASTAHLEVLRKMHFATPSRLFITPHKMVFTRKGGKFLIQILAYFPISTSCFYSIKLENDFFVFFKQYEKLVEINYQQVFLVFTVFNDADEDYRE